MKKLISIKLLLLSKLERLQKRPDILILVQTSIWPLTQMKSKVLTIILTMILSWLAMVMTYLSLALDTLFFLLLILSWMMLLWFLQLRRNCCLSLNLQGIITFIFCFIHMDLFSKKWRRSRWSLRAQWRMGCIRSTCNNS